MTEYERITLATIANPQQLSILLACYAESVLFGVTKTVLSLSKKNFEGTFRFGHLISRRNGLKRLYVKLQNSDGTTQTKFYGYNPENNICRPMIGRTLCLKLMVWDMGNLLVSKWRR